MKNDVPKIDDLLDGINDSGLQQEPQPQEEQEEYTLLPLDETGLTDEWCLFLSNIRKEVPASSKEERLVCKIDRDIADTLDELNFSRSRSDIVNAVLLTFIKTFKYQLMDNMINSRSLLR